MGIFSFLISIMTFNFKIEDLEALQQSKSMSKLDDYGGIEKVAKDLGTSLEDGLPSNALTPEALKTRQDQLGRNYLHPPAEKTLLGLIWEGLQDKTLIMLCIAAVISLILGVSEDPSSGWIEGTAILVAVAVVVLVSALNDFQKEQQFRKLNAK